MKKSLILSIMLCLACGMQAKKWTARDVVAIINKVNNYWQANNKAEVALVLGPCGLSQEIWRHIC